jgi:hypothetical protein
MAPFGVIFAATNFVGTDLCGRNSHLWRLGTNGVGSHYINCVVQILINSILRKFRSAPLGLI